MMTIGVYIQSRADDDYFVELPTTDNDYAEIFPAEEGSEFYLKAHYKNGVLDMLIQMPDDIVIYPARENEEGK